MILNETGKYYIYKEKRKGLYDEETAQQNTFVVSNIDASVFIFGKVAEKGEYKELIQEYYDQNTDSSVISGFSDITS